MNLNDPNLFANFIQLKPRIPRWLWHLLRVLVIAGFALLVVTLFYQNELALLIFWGLLVPVLPMVFWLAPGLWRNLCPLAMSNQIPRLFGFSLQKEVPAGLKRYANVIGLLLLFIAVPLRKIALNHDGELLAFALIAIISAAFVGGLLFKGKSGWCGSFCPLLPVQRLYGQTPIIRVVNSHCNPCVGCTKNCFDFNPQVAWLADLYDRDPVLPSDRKFFAGMMPGLLLAYFTLEYNAEMNWYTLYINFGFYCLIGIGAYYVLENLLKLSPQLNTALFAVISLNIFYFYIGPVIFTTIEQLAHWNIPPWPLWSFRTLIALLSLYWLYQTIQKEKLFLSSTFASSAKTKVANVKSLKKHAEKQTQLPTVTLEPGEEKLVNKSDMSLLDLLEANGHNINSGCRMGACGADPVAIIEGEENLNEKSAEEQATLERLGYLNRVRMACCVKLAGHIKINLDPSVVASTPTQYGISQDDSIRSVVIIGNGIAGVTAADFVRRFHRDCEIHLIGAEKYPLYNRMAISKLIYGRTALQKLILMPDDWYIERNIQQWLNTQVARVNSLQKQVELATNETISYDRLIITSGSQARVPRIDNWGIKGSFVLRTAEDGMQIRHYLQSNRCKKVIIAGGGLLGLEAAFAFSQLGLRVSVLERSDHLLRRQLDSTAATILHTYLSALGITIIYNAETASLVGEQLLEAVRLKTGETIKTDLLLVAAGIEMDLSILKNNPIASNRGILVNNKMQTNDKNIYAAGDIAEIENSDGKIPGLWPVAVEQGRIAAANAMGGDESYQPKPIATGLKVVGVELTSMGALCAPIDGKEFSLKQKDKYRKIVLDKENYAIGCIVLGQPEVARQLSALVSQNTCLNAEQITKLDKGDWDFA